MVLGLKLEILTASGVPTGEFDIIETIHWLDMPGNRDTATVCVRLVNDSSEPCYNVVVAAAGEHSQWFSFSVLGEDNWCNVLEFDVVESESPAFQVRIKPSTATEEGKYTDTNIVASWNGGQLTVETIQVVLKMFYTDIELPTLPLTKKRAAFGRSPVNSYDLNITFDEIAYDLEVLRRHTRINSAILEISGA